MGRFHYTFEVEAPPEDVMAFYRSPGAFRKLNPPGMPLQLHRADPLADGAIMEFTIWAGPLPIRWVAHHRDVGDDGFTDEQVEGPMARWVHRHQVDPAGLGRARISERIEFAYKSGLAGVVGRVLFSPWALSGLFWYRTRATRKALSGSRA